MNRAYCYYGRMLAVAALTLMVGTAAVPAWAQQAPPAAPSTVQRALPPISLDLRDAPIRQALEQLFNSAGVQFAIAPNVAGFITLRIADQPFDNALRLIMRASSVPLSYFVEGGVYFVRPRPLVDPAHPITLPVDVTNPKLQYLPLEQIQLTYIDAADLSSILGVTNLPNFTRGQQAGNALGSGRGGLGGSLGGALGGGLGGLSGGFGGGSLGGGGFSGGGGNR